MRHLAMCCALTMVFVSWTAKECFHANAGTFEVRPYILEQDEYSITNGAEHVFGHRTEARRSDGSTMVTEHQFGGNDLTLRSIHLSDGTVAMVSDQASAKMSGKLSATQLSQRNSALQNVSSRCIDDQDVMDGQEILLGQKAVRVVIGSSDPLRRTIQWRLPDFQCSTVATQVQSRTDPNGEWTATLGTRLTAFSAAEPNAAQFSDWLGYEEMKASDIRRKVFRQRGVTAKDCPTCFADDPTDKLYEESRQSKP